MIGALNSLSSWCCNASPRWGVKKSSAWKPTRVARMVGWLRWASRRGRDDTATEATGVRAARRRELSAICPGSDIAAIGLSIFAARNLTKRARCLAVIRAKRWLYSCGGPDRHGFHRRPDQRATE